MAEKGISTRSEALEFDDFQRLIDGLHDDGQYRWELFCYLSYCFALRISDVLSLRWGDLIGKDICTMIEKKTGKTRRIPLEPSVLKRVRAIHSLMSITDDSELVFLNQKSGVPYSSQYINKQLKTFKVRYRLPIKNFSSHSFRKTFGRHIYETNGRTDHSILMVNRALRHQNIDTTIIYLGLRQQDLDVVYKQAAIF